MRNIHDVVIKPIVTEKSMEALQQKKYTFRVANDANKIEIANAVEKLFNVKVRNVNTMHVRGRKKRMGMHVGYQPDWKKAIVTLKDDSKGIEFFESML